MSHSYERKGILVTPRCRMDLREIGQEVLDWIHLAHYRDQWLAIVNTVMNFRVP
jgi:hypothetical protein